MTNKVLFIAWKDIRETFTDRNLLLIMLVTPLVLSTIIAVALGDVTAASFNNIPVVVVNLDEGVDNLGGDEVNYGEIFVSTLIPDEASGDGVPACESDANGEEADGPTLFDLTDARLGTDPVRAREVVDDGNFVAAIIIPANYSEQLIAGNGDPVMIEVYADTARSISAEIIRSIAVGINNQIITGQIAVSSTVSTLVASGNIPDVDQSTFACAFSASFSTLGITTENVGGTSNNPLVMFGSAQAAFFALFTASGGATAILEERRNGTLQRLLVSPTPRLMVLFGKLLGIFMTVLIQLVFLVVGFTFVNSLLEGEFSYIWGSNFALIGLLLLATAMSAASIGMILAATARTIDQSSVLGSVVAMFMGMFGGAFFPVDLLGPLEMITRLSIVRWSSEAFIKLSSGQTDILLNVAVLFLLGIAFFIASLMIFNRRQDV